MLGPFVIVFCMAFAFAWIFTPIMRNVAIAYGIIDRPDGGRKLHTKPVAYLGGVAIFIGLIAGLFFGQAFSEVPAVASQVRIPIPIVAGATIIMLLGLLDDLRGIRPKLKVLGQVAAAVVLLANGIGNEVLREPTAFLFEWLHVNLNVAVPEGVESGVVVAASSAFVVALVVFCCNASNLMDGLDGLCGGVTAIIAGGLVFVAANLAIGGDLARANDDAVRLALSLALFGAVLGIPAVQLQSGQHLHGRRRQPADGLRDRDHDPADRRRGLEVDAGRAGDVQPAGARHGAGFRAGAGRPGGRCSAPTSTTSTTSSSPAA